MSSPRTYVSEVMDAIAEETGFTDAFRLRLYALLALAKGADTTPEDVHGAWVLWMVERNSRHRLLVPFDQLPSGVQELERSTVEAIHKVAKRLCAAGSE